MRRWLLILFVLIILSGGAVWYFLFNKPIRPVEPVRSTLDSTLALPVSTIRIPIEFQLKDLEKMVNTKLKGIFVQEWMPVGEKKETAFI